jgi:tetratricopeptide (TPR) repeat protein
MAKRPQKKKRPPEVGQVEVTEAKGVLPGKSPGIPWRTIVQALVIAAAVLWIYRPVLHGGWLWDDDMYITANSLLHDPARLWKIWFVPGDQIDYYPIEQTIQWIEWELFGDATFGYHLTNVFLHIMGALLVWRLLGKFHLRLAWVGGLIFAIHPVQVESVAWSSELKNTLSLPPFLLAMCAWMDYEERGKAKDYFLALGLFLAAMLCKTTMVMFPVAILLYAWWKRGQIGWHDLKASGPFFVVSLALGLLTVWLQHHEAMDQMVNPLGGVFSRLAGAGLSLSFYFSKCFLPVGLMPVYPKWPVDSPSLLQFLPWLVLSGTIYWLWMKRESWGRHALLGLGFFLIILEPFLGFNAAAYMTFTWVMDHFLYIPIIGLIGLVVAALGQMEMQLPASFRPCGIGLVAGVLAILAFESRDDAKMFINEETLWTYELRYNPGAFLAYNNLGEALAQKGLLSEAIGQFEQALRVKPDYTLARVNLGDALLQTGRVSEAMEQFEEALRTQPNDPWAHNSLGEALVQMGRLPEAVEQYEQALRIQPGYAKTYNNLGSALGQMGRLSEAMEQFEQALRIQPDNVLAHSNLGNVLLQTGRIPEAIEQYEEALQINPNYAEAHNNLGLALFQAGRVSEAIDAYRQALRIKPDDAETYYNLGNALQQAGRVSEAIDAYRQALRIKPDDAEVRNNLGSAFGQMGRLSEAREQFEQVLSMNPNDTAARDNLARLQALEKAAPANK